jgi:hypothetical protein
MEKSALSSLRHAARGSFNAIKLCVCALDLPCTREEQLEFIEDIIRTSDQIDGVLDELVAAIDQAGASPTCPD